MLATPYEKSNNEGAILYQLTQNYPYPNTQAE